MVDFRVRDTFPTHPKTLGITLNAVGLWTLCGAWSALHRTDGIIPTAVVAAHKDWKRATAELVDRHLWAETEGGWVFIDWAQHQRTRAQIEAETNAWKERQARARARRSGDVTA
jgi:hypothetical protein